MKTKKKLIEEMTTFLGMLGEYETDLLFLDLDDLAGLYPNLTKEQIKKDWLDLRSHLRMLFRG